LVFVALIDEAESVGCCSCKSLGESTDL
jgi:hypothetical protein